MLALIHQITHQTVENHSPTFHEICVKINVKAGCEQISG